MASTRKFTSLARSAKASMRCEAPQMQKETESGTAYTGPAPTASPDWHTLKFVYKFVRKIIATYRPVPKTREKNRVLNGI